MKKKILLIQFRHESNSFCPVPANEQAYRNFRFDIGTDVFPNQRGIKTELGAFLDVLEGDPDFELIPSVALSASPSGPVTEDVYDFVMEEVKKIIQAHEHIDGVLFNCHGAMVAEGHPDGEGDLFEMVRKLVGDDIPLVSSLDLHANVTAKMARCANALIPYECYPHTDTYETGYLAAQIMAETLKGQLSPVMAYRRIPFLLPLFPSEFPEIRPLYQLAEKLGAQKNVRSVRFTHGFFPADIEEMGMAVMVITNGDKELAEKIADEMERAITESIPKLKREYPALDDALDAALKPGKGPVVIADASDNPGAGGIGDSTHILRRILERGMKGAAVATILDPDAVEACIRSGVGTSVRLHLGGHSDSALSGGPLDVAAYVRSISDGNFVIKCKMSQGEIAHFGKCAVVEIEGNSVIIASVPRQPYDLEIFRRHGIAPEEQNILVTKSAIHYRDSYGTIARDMIAVSLPGYATPIPEGFSYKNWKSDLI